MIVCPNCSHQNPEGAVQCEACYTPLPATAQCPNCGASVQVDANFCGQCGCNLRTGAPLMAIDDTSVPAFAIAPLPNSPQPALQHNPVGAATASNGHEPDPKAAVATPAPAIENFGAAAIPMGLNFGEPKTQLQQQTARLVHVRTDTAIELPQNLSVIHIGKWNDRVPPDIDISGFPDSEIVSRIHANIRVEGDAHYIEDVGSSNGTYINNLLLPLGNRHRLRRGDRISLGKGDRVTFLFQIS